MNNKPVVIDVCTELVAIVANDRFSLGINTDVCAHIATWVTSVVKNRTYNICSGIEGEYGGLGI